MSFWYLNYWTINVSITALEIRNCDFCHYKAVVITHRYDDYDYGEVNQLLERSLKVYIKTVTCYPERTTKRMYDSYWRQFKHSEKVCFMTKHYTIDRCSI